MEVVGGYPPDVGLLGSERFLRLRLLGRGNVLIEDVRGGSKSCTVVGPETQESGGLSLDLPEDDGLLV